MTRAQLNHIAWDGMGAYVHSHSISFPRGGTSIPASPVKGKGRTAPTRLLRSVASQLGASQFSPRRLRGRADTGCSQRQEGPSLSRDTGPSMPASAALADGGGGPLSTRRCRSRRIGEVTTAGLGNRASLMTAPTTGRAYWRDARRGPGSGHSEIRSRPNALLCRLPGSTADHRESRFARFMATGTRACRPV